MSEPVLRASGVARTYPGRGGGAAVRAVRGVDLTIAAGESLGVVGESGCGKSTLGRVLVGLEPATSGTVEVAGHRLSARRRTTGLARDVQLVFQDPFSSLNPRRSVESTLGEVLRVHRLVRGRTETARRVRELLDMVALGERFAARLPHEMSGGQAQRVAIARALAVQPSLLVLDEPTSALDVSVRAEIVNLLADLRTSLNVSYLFISHDMAVIRHVSDRVAVMYRGRFVEVGPSDEVFAAPRHAYTRLLLDAVPVADPNGSLLADPAEGTATPAPGAAGDGPDVPDLVEVVPGHFVAGPESPVPDATAPPVSLLAP